MDGPLGQDKFLLWNLVREVLGLTRCLCECKRNIEYIQNNKSCSGSYLNRVSAVVYFVNRVSVVVCMHKIFGLFTTNFSFIFSLYFIFKLLGIDIMALFKSEQ